jgi:hypothetical protein
MIFSRGPVCRVDSDVGQIAKTSKRSSAISMMGSMTSCRDPNDCERPRFPQRHSFGRRDGRYRPFFADLPGRERTFELIAQAVGRSGRSSKVGEAMIQTFNPSITRLSMGRGRIMKGFFKKEMQERKIAHYPPYVF